MKVTKACRPGETITVDLLKPSSLSPDGWLKPLEFETTEPPTLYLRMPIGNYGVRVMCKVDTELRVYVDGNNVLETKVAKGIHVFERDGQGRPFQFGEAPAGEPALIQRTLFDSDELATCVQTHGQVTVQVRFAEDGGSTNADIIPDEFGDPVVFQMNAPGAHEEVLAGLLSKIKKPEKLTSAHDVFGDYKELDELPQRHCCNCPDHDHH